MYEVFVKFLEIIPCQSNSLCHLLVAIYGYLLYMSWSHLYIGGDNTQAQRIAQSDSVSEAARNLRRNPIRLG